MTVGELREMLEEYDDATEVRIASQPRWAFEYAIDGVAAVDPCDGDDLDEDGYERGPEDGGPVVVYLAEGTQIGYLPQAAAVAVGWS